MMEIVDIVKQLIQPILDEEHVLLYDVLWIRNEHTLQVSIMKEDGTMDLDTCAEVSEKISALLDQKDPIQGEYTLEVCSPGAEREIRNLDELDHMAGSYVFVRLKEPVKKMMEITGEIETVEDGIITIDYRDKTAHRKAQFSKDNIQYIRLAVRI
jgi:ribosome maturation factor RimP